MPRAWALLALAGLAVGVILRAVQFAANRSLWLDEAWLAESLLVRDFVGLLQPLESNQVAPIGFLWPTKALVLGFGSSEYVLRLMSFVGGVAALVVCYRLARRILTPGAVPIAVWVLAISEPLVYYSAELKQYSTDFFWTSLLLLLFLSWWDQPPRLRRSLSLFLVGLLGLLSSHPAIFTLAGVSVFAVIATWRKGDKGRLRPAFLMGLGWATVFLVHFFLLLRSSHSNGFLARYWEGAFLPWPPTSVEDLEWFLDTFFGLFTDPVGLAYGALGGFLFIAGCAALRSRGDHLAILLAPVGVAVLASGLDSYPLRGRLLLFLVPIAVLALAEGVAYLSRLFGRDRSWVTIAALLFLLFFQPGLDIAARIPMENEEIKPVLEYLSETRTPDDPIFVFWGAEPAMSYYAPRYGLDMEEVLLGRFPGLSHRRGFRQEMEGFQAGDRVWLVFSHFVYDGVANQREVYLGYIEGRGEILNEMRATGASVHLFEFSG